MTDTANLGLPCIEGSQAQKHVTHNDALRILDTLVQLAVLDRDLTAPPGSPLEGQRWIVKTGATGAWAGHVNAIAAWQDGAWQFSAPQTGWVAFVADEGTLLVWNGTAWGDFFSAVTSIQNLALLGVGTTADSTNVLSAKLNNALFVAKTVAEGGDGNLRYKLSKESASKTLSFLLQDNYSGRAEIGLTGDDDFHFKVSPDGSTWYEAIKVAAATGKVSFPISGGPREVLTANRTYYVRTDGNNANSGLADTAGAAWLTFQSAINFVVANLDFAGFTVIITHGSETGKTFTGQINVPPWSGGGALTVQGNGTSNTLISTAGNAFAVNLGALPGLLTIKNLKIATSSGNCFVAAQATAVTFDGVEFGSCAGSHVLASAGGVSVSFASNYMISGGATAHWMVNSGGVIQCVGKTITLTGSPVFSTAFANTGNIGVINSLSNTFSGSTGASSKRYNVVLNGVVNTFGGGASHFPGDTAGTTATGGQYS
jgi:hypothetical protein